MLERLVMGGRRRNAEFCLKTSAPWPMKISAIASPWHYDPGGLPRDPIGGAPSTSDFVVRLRGAVVSVEKLRWLD
jgi:hypothetical protein